MGVSVETYRCRIGLFHCRWRAVQSCRLSRSDGCCFTLLAAGIIFALLLIGGIEPNPGPPAREHKCKVCGAVYLSPSSYCKHSKIHPRYKKGGLIPCSAANCIAKISSLESFKTHFNLYHKTPASSEVCVQNESIPVCDCPIAACGQVITSLSSYVTHMNDHLREGKVFNCPLKKCPGTSINNPKQNSTHISRYHRGSEETFFPLTRLSNPTCDNIGASDPSDDVNASTASIYGSEMGDYPASQDDDEDDEDVFPLHCIKDELSRFYLRLESFEILPSSTVQLVADEIKLISEVMHEVLRKNLRNELEKINLDPDTVQHIVTQTFLSEPIFNIHHPGRDVEQLGTDHFRSKYWSQNYKFVEPIEIDLGMSAGGKKRCAQYVPVKDSLNAMLKDQEIKKMVLKSFTLPANAPDLNCPGSILQDFTDGKVFNDHLKCLEHDGKKCLQVFLFQDAFDPNAFSSTSYKPTGFYYALGNLPSHIRFRLDKIQMAFIALESDLKNSMQEELKDKDRLKRALERLIQDLIDLKSNGVVINGEQVPVCILYLIGDSLGQNFIGRYVTNFSAAEFSCRYCTMSKTEFLRNPEETGAERKPEHYDSAVRIAKKKWLHRCKKGLEAAKKRGNRAAARCSAPSKKSMLREAVSRDALKKMTSVNFKGVKYRPSPFNRPELSFHVVDHQPPCLAHDLFEGLVKKIVALILKHFIETKKWFTLDTLNLRIKSFKAKGSNAADKPKPLKSLEKLAGNAVENWNFLRLAPFIFGDLIEDEDDPFWRMLLLLKKITEYVCAPKITVSQVFHLRSLIIDIIALVKEFLASCLIPKLHYLCHYPELIFMFGPLIRLFTLRFESKHSFFKRVIKACRSHNNITFTMAKKYMYRFAYDNNCSEELADIGYGKLSAINFYSEPKKVKQLLNHHTQEMQSLTYRGTSYSKDLYLLLEDLEELRIKVGCIRKMVISQSGVVSLVLEEMTAKNTLQGYYVIDENTTKKMYSLWPVQDLRDYYPLQSYFFQSKECIALKHSVPFIF